MEIICMMDCPLEKKSSKRRKAVSAAGFEDVAIHLEAYEKIEEMEEIIKSAAQEGTKYVLVPPVFYDAESEVVSERGKDFFILLASLAAEIGVKFLIPNSFYRYHGRLIRGRFSDAQALAEFVDELNQNVANPVFGVCVDTGVCNICRQNPYEFVCALNDKVSAVLFRTNDGGSNGSAIPLMSSGPLGDSFDWKEMVRGLRTIGFSGPIIMDYRSQSRGVSHLIRGQVDILAKTIADYFVWQIELEKTIAEHPQRVLFGAGNMCHNYMKWYGKKYPPLFTCDNNSNLWGKKFEGLEIKNPDELKNIPEDCAIFICNVYYCEIEQQLRNMGIFNPIVYFNDEYLPSFYFDGIY